MTLDITVTDLFCGAGGSSLGAEAAGARLRMAANHWRLAIETHNANFPHADHDCADLSQVRPDRYPATDILIASPECTNHSQAKARKRPTTLWDAGDPAQERSRATMWDVPRFAEAHRYQLVVVENVVEATRWEPFGAWLSAMHSLGYEHKALFVNSMVAHPTPQSRDRMYVVFWRRGNPAPDLDIRPDCWCWRCERIVPGIQSWKRPERPIGKYRSQYLYRCGTCAQVTAPLAYPASSAIDWALPAPRIGDRERPLAPATIARIRAGLERYGPAALVAAAGNTYDPGMYKRAWAPWDPLPTQTTTVQHALVMETAYGGREHYGGRSRPTSDPLPTQTGQQTQALVVTMRSGDDGNRTHLPDEPLTTVTASGSSHAMVVPLRTHGRAMPADESVFPTFVAGNAGHAILTRHYRSRGNGSEMSKPVTQPFGAVTTQDHHSLTTVPFTVDYHGEGSPRSVHSPLATQDTRDRHGLVATPAIEVEDCGFRMLEPHEIQSAMAFPAEYEVRGTKRDRVRQLGNAVTPPVMGEILRRGIASLAP